MEAECLKQGTNRILEIGLSYNPGGVESFVMNYYRQLVKKGIQFDFVCMYPSLAYEDEIRKLGGKIYYTVNVKKHIRKFRQQLQEILAQPEINDTVLQEYCAGFISRKDEEETQKGE